ncbi:uncharacterized protein LOC126657575 [Mercurialis annua]|uniref:uncharacterized protein LOC126657575 n=1 Tax=Mercurialis annua TaxID=3986 RepID=UPI00215FDA7B|nr:uncharacterized protein LOC126657575 [Mercurialis annua]XP_050208241.1 uncharacterized protein LOC126657575 [Mercurialis annua]
MKPNFIRTTSLEKEASSRLRHKPPALSLAPRQKLPALSLAPRQKQPAPPPAAQQAPPAAPPQAQPAAPPRATSSALPRAASSGPSLAPPAFEDDNLESPSPSISSNLSYHGYNRIPHIHVEAKSLLPDAHGIARNIGCAFQEKQDPSGYSWLLVNKDVKQFYWEDFQRRYTWDPHAEMLIKTTWKKVAASHYNKTLNKWRDNWKKKKQIPQGVKDDIWDTWLARWESDDWKKKSKKASKNRLSEPGGIGTGIAKHTGGSRSILEHTKLMEKENGRVMNPWEVHQKLHKRKDGAFVDSKSSIINDKMINAVAIASQPQEDGSVPEVDIHSLYYDVVGGAKKKQVYGLGSQASVFYPHSFSSTSSGYKSDEEHMKQMIEQHFNDQQQHLTKQLDTLREQQESLRKHQDALQQQQLDLARREQGLHDTLQLELAEREKRLQNTMLLQMQEMWKNMQNGKPPSGGA